MKSYPDKLRELPISVLKHMIEQQEKEIVIMERDLETMKRILEERHE